MPRRRLLVFNCHEAWVHQLEHVPWPLDILVGLPGRDCAGWDRHVRPVPTNGTLVSGTAHLAHARRYDAVIVHSLADAHAVRSMDVPKLLVLHATLEGRLAEEGARFSIDEMRAATRQFLQRTGTHAVAISALKARSWGVAEDILLPGIDVERYPAASADLPRGIRIVNHAARRPHILRWDVHVEAFGGLPLTVVGHNPGIWGSEPARDWSHLRQLLQVHRFVVHTVDPALEDGYNLALLEAMACGLPVVGTRHPSSPVEHGVSGFLADDPVELREYARRLLDDQALAVQMGRAARAAVAARFSPAAFVAGVCRHVGLAAAVWREHAA